MRGTCGCTKWKVALHWVYYLTIVINYGLTFSKLSLFWNALLQCEIHILAKFNNPQWVLFRCIKRKKTIALLKYILFMINSVWAVSFCFGLFVSFFNPLTGREIWSQDFPQGLEVLPWFDQGLCQIPLSFPGLGGWGFQLTIALWWKNCEEENSLRILCLYWRPKTS